MKCSFVDWVRIHESEVRDVGIVVSFLMLAYIAKKLEFPIDINSDENLQSDNSARCVTTHEVVYSDRGSNYNVAGEVIDSILKGISENHFDSEVLKAADDIYEIAGNNKYDKHVCYTAVKALGELEKRARFSSTKRKIMELMKKIAND